MSDEQHNLSDEDEGTSRSRRVRSILPKMRLTGREWVMLGIATVLGGLWLAAVFSPRGPSGFVSDGNPIALIKQATGADELFEQTTKQSITAFEQWAYAEFRLPSESASARSKLLSEFRDATEADLENRSCGINGYGTIGEANDLHGFSFEYENSTIRGGIEVVSHTMPDGEIVLICFAWEHVR